MNTYLLAKSFLQLEGVQIEWETEVLLCLKNKYGVKEVIQNTEDAIMDYLIAE